MRKLTAIIIAVVVASLGAGTAQAPDCPPLPPGVDRPNDAGTDCPGIHPPIQVEPEWDAATRLTLMMVTEAINDAGDAILDNT